MPTYQYACTECGERLDVIQRFSDEALSSCPRCTGRLRKIFSPVGVVFKGSGFYRNDSRSAPPSDKPGDRVEARAGAGERADKAADNGKPADTGKPADNGKRPAKPAPAASGAAASGPAAKPGSSPGTAGSAI